MVTVLGIRKQNMCINPALEENITVLRVKGIVGEMMSQIFILMDQNSHFDGLMVCKTTICDHL